MDVVALGLAKSYAKSLAMPRMKGYSALPKPVVVAHRGTPYTLPEHTLQGYRAAVAAGAQQLKLDAQVLGDGALAVIHDTTMNRTMVAAGNVAAQTGATWLTQVPKGTTYVAPNTTAGTAPGLTTAYQPLMLDDLLREFGNKVVLQIEPKNDGQMAAVIAALQRWNIGPEWAILGSFFTDDLAVAAASPYPALYNVTAGGQNWASIKAMGADIVAIQYANPPTAPSITAADITGAQAAGLKAYIWIINRRAELATFTAWGADAVVTNDPAWLLGPTTAAATSDFFSLQTYPPGSQPENIQADRGSFISANSWGYATATANDTRAMMIGYMSPFKGQPAANSYTLDWFQKFTATSTDTTRYAGVFVGNTDANWENSGAAGQGVSGYMAFMDIAGNIKLRAIADGAISGGDSTAVTSAMTLGTTVAHLRLAVTPTTVTLSRVDVAGSAAKALTVGAGYLWLFRAGCAVEFSNVTVT